MNVKGPVALVRVPRAASAPRSPAAWSTRAAHVASAAALDGDVVTVAGDICDEQVVRRFVEAAEKAHDKAVDLYFANAGVLVGEGLGASEGKSAG